MEKLVKIKVAKDVYLYGKLKGDFAKPLFVIVHGLTGDMEEKLIHDAVNFFADNGFATFRLNLYDWRPKARQFIDCDLKTSGFDVDQTVRYFRKLGFQKVFIVGHSFGGPVIFSSKDQNFDAVALWDPSYKFMFNKKIGKYIKELDGYIMPWGLTTVFSKKLIDETNNLKWDFLAKNFKCPILVAVAGNGTLVKKAFNYYKFNLNQKKFKIIPKATHLFNDSDVVQNSLFKNTLVWFKSFL
ncbi:MAG: hypothetical protein K9L98_02760 [Candidatus Pacebacteria bacterium]|nr:hypothetical protein [Candidatus Paceibacterota bacterium]MCF7862906.1 hypothetical protein [Candidatus Paceibacterota bacterium]